MQKPRHFSATSTFLRGVILLLDKVAGTICCDPASSASLDVLQSCSLVYDTGFRGHRAFICQEPDGRHRGHGLTRHGPLRWLYLLCLKIFEQLAERTDPLSTRTRPPENATLIRWNWELATGSATPMRPGTETEPKIQVRPALAAVHERMSSALIPYVMTCGALCGRSGQYGAASGFSISGRYDQVRMCAGDDERRLGEAVSSGRAMFATNKDGETICQEPERSEQLGHQ